MKKFFDSNGKLVLILAILSVVALQGFFLIRSVSVSDQDYQKAFNSNYHVFAKQLPEKADFASEEVPMNLYFVNEGLDREVLVNTYWQSSTVLLLKKANRYFPQIEPILEKYGIPNDFKYVPLIESGLANVTSPAKAAGFWQLLSGTAKMHGLEVTEEVDERFDVKKSTEAACKYLLSSYKEYGSWTMAAAAYNAGDGRIKGEIQKQGISDFYNLHLNSETSRYIFRILAMKLIYEDPTSYGFNLRNKDLYPVIPTREITVDSTINDLYAFSKKLGVNYKMLKAMNPWLMKDKLTNKSGRKYTFILPAKGFDDYQSLQSNIDKPYGIFNEKDSTLKP